MTDAMERLPREIRALVEGKPYRAEEIGCSGAQVWMFADMVLKIGGEADEWKRLNWLEGKLTVPRALAFARDGEQSYLLMSRLTGEMACAADNLRNFERTALALAEGLLRVWRVDVADCPFDNGLAHDLARLLPRVEAGEVSRAQYDWLCANRPAEERVFSHGDYCLPNIFLREGAFYGLIDLGDCGVADPWRDVVQCLWSMEYNFVTLGGGEAATFARGREAFLSALGLPRDEEKRRYYARLNDLLG